MLRIPTGPGEQQDSDLSGLLAACHARIRRFLAQAEEVGMRSDAPEPEIVAASERVARYFRNALPLHVEDEEASIAPRLRGRSPAVDAALDRMADEHAGHGPLRTELVAAAEAVAAHPGHPARHARLARAAKAAAPDFEAHLQAEEASLIPALSDLLDADTQAAIVAEMRARRRP